MEFFESTYPPGSISNAHGQFLKHDGYEVGTVTAGELTIEFESELVTLGVGDSITFPCDRPPPDRQPVGRGDRRGDVADRAPLRTFFAGRAVAGV